MRETKSFPVSGFKALDENSGTAEFLVSVFGNPDRVNDIVEKGAFSTVIKSQTRKPKFVPNHDWDVTKKLGHVLDWKETDEGLVITAQFNLDKQIAKDVYSDFKMAPDDQEFSFSFDVAEKGYTVKDNVRHITEFAEIYDVGPVGVGANPATSLMTVKSWEQNVAELIAEAKAGRRDSASTLKLLKEIHSSITGAGKLLGEYIKQTDNTDNTDDEKGLHSVDSDFIDTINTSLLLTDVRLNGVSL